MSLSEKQVVDLIYKHAKIYRTPPTGGSAIWGNITGTLSNQTDLNSALNSKIDLADLSASYPLSYNSGTGAFSFGHNTTNLKITANQLNTIQDIATTSSPTFKGLSLSYPFSLTDAPFGQWGIRTATLNNLLYGATKRFTVSQTGFSDWGIEGLFNNDYDGAALALAISSTGTININLISKGEVPVGGLTYPQGTLYIHFFSTNYATSVSARMKIWNGVDAFVWASSVNGVDVAKNASYRVWEIDFGGQGAYCSEIEITMNTGGSFPAWVSEIDFLVNRSCDFRAQPYINKHQPANIFETTSWKNSSNVATASITSAGLGTFANAYVVGNLGIGISPSYKLHVVGETYITNVGAHSNFYIANATGYTSNLYVNCDTVSYQVHCNSGSTYIAASAGMNFRATSGDYTFSTTGSNTEMARLTATGSFGIGATSPENALHVSGKASFIATSNPYIRVADKIITDGTRIEIYLGYFTSPAYAILDAFHQGTGSIPLAIQYQGGRVGIYSTAPDRQLEINSANGNNLRLTYNDSNGTASYYTDFLTTSLGHLQIQPVGNIGINTTTFTEKLNLAGNFNQQGNYKIYNNFAPDWAGTGWQLDYNVTQTGANLQLDNLLVRGTMNVYELVINTIRATNGFLFVSSVGKVKSSEGGQIGDVAITFEDPEGNGVCPFTNGDILLAQIIDLNNTTVVRRVVVYVEDMIDSTTVDATYIVGASVLPGDVFARIGNDINSAREGCLYLTSDDSNAPYMDVLDEVRSYAHWTGQTKIKARLGKLNGIIDTAVGLNSSSVYGIYTNSAYLKGNLVVGGTSSLAITLPASTVVVGNVTGTANYSIKLSNTGTASTSGLFAYNSTGVEVFALRLDSTAQIAGWTFNSSQFISPSSKVTIDSTNKSIIVYPNGATIYTKYVHLGQTYVHDGETGLAWTGGYGISAVDGNGTTLFRLDDLEKQIAGWFFDTAKFYTGSATAGLAINKSSTPYITGNNSKGFEVYDSSSPKMFIGLRNASAVITAGMDWNVTTANTLTIKGNITAGNISGVTITGSTFNTATGYPRISLGINETTQGANALYFINTSTPNTYEGAVFVSSGTTADTGTYPTTLTHNHTMYLGSWKINSNYSTSRFNISLLYDGTPFMLFRSTQQGNEATDEIGIYIKRSSSGTLDKVLGKQMTGWGTPTGTLYRTALTNATTQTNFNQALMALITDLLSHGMIGA